MNLQHTKLDILILSRNQHLYSTNSLILAGQARGHNMYVVNHTECTLLNKKNKIHIYNNGIPLQKFDAVIPRIGAGVTDYGATVIKHFELLNIHTVISSDSLMLLRNKFRCLQTLNFFGVPTPKTFLVGHHFDIENIKHHLGNFPIVLKILESTQGAGVILLDNIHTAVSVIQAFQKSGINFLLQEFIEESKGMDIRVFVVDGLIVATMLRKAADDDFRSNLHRGGGGEIVELSTEERRVSLKVAKILRLKVAGIDILRSRKGPLVIEVNASPGLEGIEKITKVNISDKIISMIESRVAYKNNHENTK